MTGYRAAKTRPLRGTNSGCSMNCRTNLGMSDMAEAVEEKKAPAGKTVLGHPVERFEPRPGQTKAQIIEDFHKLSYSAAFEEGLTWQHTKWLGVPMFKMPQDLLTLTEVIGDVKPHLIIETGTAAGGSALFMATY